MVSIAKSILISILAMIVLILLMNIAFFFPWYLTVVDAAFAVSQMVATDNYLSYDNYELVRGMLVDKPVFEARSGDDELMFIVNFESDFGVEKSLIEEGETRPLSFYYGKDDEDEKIYVQRGNIVRVTIHAQYPIRVGFMDNEADEGGNRPLADIPIDFSMTTTTLRLCKDLPYEGYFEPEDYESDDDPNGGGDSPSETSSLFEDEEIMARIADQQEEVNKDVVDGGVGVPPWDDYEMWGSR